MSKLDMASSLVVNDKSCPKEYAQDSARLKGGQSSHSSAEGEAKLRLAGLALIRNRFSWLAEPFDVARNGVASHFNGFRLRAAKSNDARKHRDCHLKTCFHRISKTRAGGWSFSRRCFCPDGFENGH